MITPTQSTISLHQEILALSLDNPDSIWGLECGSANRYTFVITHEHLPHLDMNVNIRGQSHNIKTEFSGKTHNDVSFYTKTARQFKETIQASLKTRGDSYMKSLEDKVRRQDTSHPSDKHEFQSRLERLRTDPSLLWGFASESILRNPKKGPKWLDTLKKSVDYACETAKDEVVSETHNDFDEYWDIKVVEK
ncbi:hypothetical protein I302_101863 [Kwoniella bestiolae CBS 10118]|uniref:Uncharacterized protein n=1 Tax=Kwoniella bestiolae CBS 10118 TaxID=1296100 RepID=A0A1B9GDF6_9TREE|nr:hypothetical protein I302_00542 [Kwoniella bestiolae CBS 10118]OCF29051.1 hypothetical protein I302_00542 [Kwoniella bestiolae CBS 10118]